MVEQERRYPPDDPAMIPYISREALKAFHSKQRDFDHDFETFKKDQPELARWLVTGNIGVDPNYLREKHALAIGVVSYHALLRGTLEAARLRRAMEEGMSLLPNDGDAGDADLPPSA